jgi:hypothetical protein
MPINLQKIEERGARWANILAVIPGAYCAFAIFSQRNSGMVSAMNQSWPFILSVVVFLCCICLAAILNFLRRGKEVRPSDSKSLAQKAREDLRTSIRRDTESLTAQAASRKCEAERRDALAKVSELQNEIRIWESKSVPWSGYESEQAWRNAIDEQNRLVNLGHKVDGLFAPLQVDALMVAKDIALMLKALPIPPNTDFGFDEQTQKFRTPEQVHAWFDAKGQVEQRLRARYALNFHDKTMKIYHQFVEAGIEDGRFGTLADTARTSEEFTKLVSMLRTITFELEDLKP